MTKSDRTLCPDCLRDPFGMYCKDCRTANAHKDKPLPKNLINACRRCEGTGKILATRWIECPTCKGAGIIETPLTNKKPVTGALATQAGGNHYKIRAIQPIEYCHANKLGACESSIIKYATRHKDKGGRLDVEKIIHYAELLLQLEYDTEEKANT